MMVYSRGSKHLESGQVERPMRKPNTIVLVYPGDSEPDEWWWQELLQQPLFQPTFE